MKLYTIKEISELFGVSKSTVTKRLSDCQISYVDREFHTSYYSYEKECTAYKFADVVSNISKDNKLNRFFQDNLASVKENSQSLPPLTNSFDNLSSELKIAGTHIDEMEGEFVPIGRFIYLKPEPDNKFDDKALKVFDRVWNRHLGYVYKKDQDIIYNSKRFQENGTLLGMITDVEEYSLGYDYDEPFQRKFCKWFL